MSQSDQEKVIAWIESEMGGRVEHCALQMRWRQSWFVDLKRDGEILPLYVRGDRNEDFPWWPLEYERDLLDLLWEGPVPVPKVYGLCPDPRAIVLERVPGRPGLSTAENEAERRTVLDDLAQHMASMHMLDISPFIAAGLAPPQTREELVLPPFLRESEKTYLRYKAAPDPRMDFVLHWLRRNLPEPSGNITFIHGDPGQFIFEDGRITAMLDFEIASLGDPMMDLGGLRMRAINEPMGDIAPFFKRYAELTGRPIDRDALAFQTVCFCISTALIITPSLAQTKAGVDYPEYLSWYIDSLMFALDAIADINGITLKKPAELEPRPQSRWAPIFDGLSSTFGEADGADAEEQGTSGAYRRGLARRLTAFALKRDLYGAAMDEDYVRDVSDYLGRTFADWRDADAALEKFVATAGPEADEPLIQLLYRWCWRQAILLDGVVANEMWKLRLQPLSELLD